MSQIPPPKKTATENTSPAPGGASAEAERADAINQLAGAVAHEFSNLLTALNGRLELLLDRFPGAGAERHLLLDMKMGIDAAGRITRQLQAISGRQTTRPEPTDLNALVEDAADVVQQIAGAASELRLDLVSALPVVTVDQRLVHQILFGLIAVVREALPTDAKLTVTTAVESDLLGPTIRLTVSDSRVWPDRDVTRIFEPQPSTGRQARGAGLALAAIRGAVQQCGGTIVCERLMPSGIAFHIRFPLRATERE